MRVTKGVTSVLQQLESRRILLVKRSNQVRTFQGKWSMISGSVEQGEELRETAIREIEEETRLSPSILNFVRSGRPLQIYNPSYNRLFIIHPFLFTLSSRYQSDVKLDWENSESDWVLPSEFHLKDTIPKLKETYHRVSLDDSPRLEDLIKKLVNSDGNREIEEAAEIVAAFPDLIEEDIRKTLSPSEYLSRLRNAAWHLWEARGNLAHPLVGNAVVEVLAKVYKAFVVEEVLSESRKYDAEFELDLITNETQVEKIHQKLIEECEKFSRHLLTLPPLQNKSQGSVEATESAGKTEEGVVVQYLKTTSRLLDQQKRIIFGSSLSNLIMEPKLA